MKWTIVEPAMYQIAATFPTLRPILSKALLVLSSFSNGSGLQKSGNRSVGAVEAAGRDRFVKLDDYHYMHNSKDAKDMGRT